MSTAHTGAPETGSTDRLVLKMKWLEEQGGKEEAPVCRGRGAPDGEGRVLLAEGGVGKRIHGKGDAM